MSQHVRAGRTETVRRWQQRLTQAVILFSIAGAVALAWSLLADATGADGSSWTLTGLSAGSGSAAMSGSQSGGRAANGEAGQATSSVHSLDAGLLAASNAPAGGTGTGPAGGQTAGPGSSSPVTSSPGGPSAGSAASTPAAAPRSLLPRPSSEDDIPVYIVGAVARPGVYIVRRGSYLYELVDLAGGLTAEAAAMSVNLALKLSENQMVRIPTQAEVADPLNPDPYPTGIAATRSSTININTASEAELEQLPGIGPATAAAIVADRKRNGPFQQPEDIMRVAGVKESRYEQLEPLIAVR